MSPANNPVSRIEAAAISSPRVIALVKRYAPNLLHGNKIDPRYTKAIVKILQGQAAAVQPALTRLGALYR